MKNLSKWGTYSEEIKRILSETPEVQPMEVVNKLNLDLDSYERQQLSKHIKRNLSHYLDNYEGIYSATDSLDIDNTTVKHMWIKNKEASLFVKNPNFISENTKVKTEEIDFLSIFKGKIEPIFIKKKMTYNDALFDRVVISDIHIGMDVNKDGYSLYSGKWDEDEINDRLDILANEIIDKKKSDTLLIHELGDYLDGWDGYTTRGGHKLPQNMDNQKAFDVGFQFKIKLIDALFLHYTKIHIANICNDNHAGAFGYVVNSAFKTYIELKYPDNIEVINQRKFIDHYTIGNKCFILTHGKDDKSMKFGFKPKLDPVQIEKIKDYIDEYKLHGYDIEFCKGDSHQFLFDLTSSATFGYYNFPAFSPPSDWVKTNFKNTLSGFVMFNYYDKQKTIHPYVFDKQK